MKEKTAIWLFLILISGIFLISPVLGAIPVASFISNASSGNVPLTVQFMDSSLNTPTSWTWLFGDGGISSLQNPAHIYTTPGTYTVTLIASNSAGSNTATYQGYITATKAASVPIVSFVTNVTSGSPHSLSSSWTPQPTHRVPGSGPSGMGEPRQAPTRYTPIRLRGCTRSPSPPRTLQVVTPPR